MNVEALVAALVQKHLQHAKEAEKNLELPGWWQARIRRRARREVTRAAEEGRAMAFVEAIRLVREWSRNNGSTPDP